VARSRGAATWGLAAFADRAPSSGRRRPSAGSPGVGHVGAATTRVSLLMALRWQALRWQALRWQVLSQVLWGKALSQVLCWSLTAGQ